MKYLNIKSCYTMENKGCMSCKAKIFTSCFTCACVLSDSLSDVRWEHERCKDCQNPPPLIAATPVKSCFIVSHLRITITVASLNNAAFHLLFHCIVCSAFKSSRLRIADWNSDWFCSLLLSSGKVNKHSPRLDYALWCTWYITVFTLLVTEAWLFYINKLKSKRTKERGKKIREEIVKERCKAGKYQTMSHFSGYLVFLWQPE